MRRSGDGVAKRFCNRAAAAIVMIFLLPLLVAPAAAAADVTPPTTPPGPVATVSGDTVTLSWGASTDESGGVYYEVHTWTYPAFTPDDDTFLDVSTGTSYVDTGVPPGVWYYRVVAVDEAGNPSEPSPTAGATVQDVAPPTAPGSVATAVSGSTVTVSWAVSTDNVGVTSYAVHRSAVAGDVSSSTVVATSTGTSTVESSVPNGTWHYSVIALDAAGNRSSPGTAASTTVLVLRAPAAPSSLSAFASRMTNSTTLRWRMTDYGAPAATSYVVTLQPGGKQLTVSAQSVTLSDLMSGTTYTFTVYAQNSVGASPSATSSPFVARGTAPPVVTGLTVTPGRQQAMLSWTNPDVPGFGGVVVQRTHRDSVTGAEIVVEVYRGTGTTATSIGLLEAKNYTFRILPADQPATRQSVYYVLYGSYLYRWRSATRVVYGGELTHTTMLTRVGRVPVLAGQNVELYGRRLGAATWSRACTTVTSPGGSATCTTKPTRNTVYEWRFLGGGDQGSATSKPYVIRVQPKVTATASRATVARGGSFTLSGSVAPRHARQKVYLQRLSGTSWVSISRAVLSTRSTYSFRVTPRSAASYRVYKTSDSDHSYGISPVRRVSVT